MKLISIYIQNKGKGFVKPRNKVQESIERNNDDNDQINISSRKKSNFQQQIRLLVNNLITIMQSAKKNNDRFIPNHMSSTIAMNIVQPVPSLSGMSYEEYIKNNMISSSRLLQYNQKLQTSTISSSSDLFSPKNTKTTDSLKIGGNNFRTLDAPDYIDDFYLNNISWCKYGPMAVALNRQVFLYDPTYVSRLCQIQSNQYVTSVKFLQEALSIGLSDGIVVLYDIYKGTPLRKLFQHQKRVVAQQTSGNLLITGSKDKKIFIHDVRIRDSVIAQLNEHKSEVCSLSQKPNSSILASGGNDDKVIIWDMRKQSMIHKFKGHKGAIKALSWCPWKNNILASGGGAGDRSLKLWNTAQKALINQTKTEGQVSGLVWNQPLSRLFSSHCNPDNKIKGWKIDGQNYFNQTCEFKGHQRRILQLIQSPSQDCLCSVGADESLRFWQLNIGQKSPETEKDNRWSIKLK